jgi:hypothetical protein
MAAARARLPKPVRRYVQKWIRNFVFAGLTFLTLWQMSITLIEYQKSMDIMKMYGFVGGGI